MARIPAKLTNERREQVWNLMLTGHNPQSIIKTLGTTQTVIYNDIKFLTNRSKEYVYEIAQGGFALAYQRSIEGISFTMSEAWRKFNSDQVPEKQKPVYLRLIKDCHESILQQVINGPAFIAIDNLRKRIERAGINLGVGLNNVDLNLDVNRGI